MLKLARSVSERAPAHERDDLAGEIAARIVAANPLTLDDARTVAQNVARVWRRARGRDRRRSSAAPVAASVSADLAGYVDARDRFARSLRALPVHARRELLTGCRPHARHRSTTHRRRTVVCRQMQRG